MSVRLRLNPDPARAHAERCGSRGVERAARLLLEESRRRAPVDTGELRESASVQTNRLESVISYAAAHAAVVHETHPEGRKFLENPANEPGLRREMCLALAREARIP